MRVVCYAINGSGIGHLRRLTAIARWLRRFAGESSIPFEIYFLTTSEASHLLFAEKFAAFKLPSRQVLESTRVNSDKFNDIAKAWTAHTLEILKPDLLLVDTFPAGYYDELLENLSFCRQTAVIHRPLKFDNIDGAAFYQALTRYDSIIVPENKEMTDVKIPLDLKNKTEYFGAVMCREKAELFDRKSVRFMLNVKDKEFLIYLSAGGGGDEEAEKRIHYYYESLLKIKNIKFVVGSGALYRGRRIYAPNVIWLTNENAFEMMPGFDTAISAAGYNSFHELLYAGVPTIFIPQQKWADDQFRRAKKAVQAGAAGLFEKLPEAEKLQDLIENWRDSRTRTLISQKAQNFVPTNYASQIARNLFDRLFSK